MAPDIRHLLRDHVQEMSAQWQRLNVPLAGHFYRARRLSSLRNINLFADLTDNLGIAPEAMGRETLVVTGAGPQSSDGFIILEDHADLAKADRAHGEDLLDTSCAIAEDKTP
jgi:CDP-diacylglycerol pyrophosphatase